MEKSTVYTLLTFIGGLFMLFGVYYAYRYDFASVSVIVGTILFFYGLVKDMRRKAR